MAAAINQKEYLKRYLLGGDDSTKKKKKKKSKHALKTKGLQIVDADEGSLQRIPFGYGDNEDDAPTVAEVTYDCAATKLKEEYRVAGGKWKTAVEEDGEKSTVQNEGGDLGARNKRSANEISSCLQEGSTYSKTASSTKSLTSNNNSHEKRKRHDSDSDESHCRDIQNSDNSLSTKKRHDSDSDESSNKKQRHEEVVIQSKSNSHKSLMKKNCHDSDKSPRRKARHDSDESPPKKARHDSDESPPKKARHDSDESPPRKARHDSDESPPRRKRHNLNEAPPRKRHDSDQSPPRGKRYDSDESPPRRKNNHNESPPRKKVNQHDSDESPPRIRPQEKDLRPEKQLTTQEYLHARSRGKLRKDTPEEAARKEREGVMQQAAEEKHRTWNKGLAQLQQRQQQVADIAHEMGKSFARTADDMDINELQKARILENDPMLEYLSKKKEKKQAGPKKPLYEGPFPLNRFNIRPGYRWDGVDRSNGFEENYFAKQSSKVAIEEDAYRYCVEDM